MEESTHRLTLAGRQRLTMSGVQEVVSFDESTVILHTELGTLTVQGKDLHLQNLSLEGGDMEITGTVSALMYEEPRAAGWLGRLLG